MFQMKISITLIAILLGLALHVAGSPRGGRRSGGGGRSSWGGSRSSSSSRFDDIVYSDEKKDLCNTRVFGSATDVSQIYLRSWFSRRSSSSSSSSSRSSRLNAGVEFFFLNLLHLFFFLNVASGQLQGGTHQDGK